MKALKYLQEKDILQKGINILMKELGPVETARFINIPRTKRIDSVKRHREWQKRLNKEEFFNKIF